MVSALPPDVRLASVLLDQLLLPPLHHHPLNRHPLEDQHRLQDPVEVHFDNCVELRASWPAQYMIHCLDVYQFDVGYNAKYMKNIFRVTY